MKTNLQKPEPSKTRIGKNRRYLIESGGPLEVHSIFRTIQGEGPFAGTPAVFIRLAGCNLQCPMCDTEYTSKREGLRPSEIVAIVEGVQYNGLVVITGGEPFRQDIADLMAMLIKCGYYVQVESNGSLPPTPDWLWSTRIDKREGSYLVVSPKKQVCDEAFKVACCLKYVISADYVHAGNGLPTRVLGYRMAPAYPPKGWDRPIYIQPADEQDPIENIRNRDAAVDSAMEHGYILQLQIHKTLGME